MSKSSLVKMADILSNSGYSTNPILRLIGYPKVRSLVVTATAVDNHLVKIYKGASSHVVEGGKMASIEGLTPLSDYVESAVENDGSGDWSISRSRLDAYFSNSDTAAIYFGDKTEGDEDDKEIPVVHRLSIPAVPSWPTPSFLHARYPTPKT